MNYTQFCNVLHYTDENVTNSACSVVGLTVHWQKNLVIQQCLTKIHLHLNYVVMFTSDPSLRVNSVCICDYEFTYLLHTYPFMCVTS